MREPSFFQCLRAPAICDEWRATLQEEDFAKATRSADFSAMRRFFWINWGVVDNTSLTFVTATFSQVLLMIWVASFVSPWPSGELLFAFWFGSLVCYELFFSAIKHLYNKYHSGYRSRLLEVKYREVQAELATQTERR